MQTSKNDNEALLDCLASWLMQHPDDNPKRRALVDRCGWQRIAEHILDDLPSVEARQRWTSLMGFKYHEVKQHVMRVYNKRTEGLAV